ncbi:MAG: hypothetical protein U0234_25685 [Sandaracinus sp.]
MRRIIGTALVLLGWAWLPASGGAQDAASPTLPAEALVAIVGAETPDASADLVLLSDVDLRARLDLGPAGARVVPPPSLYAATLDEILGEILIAREASRLHAAEPTDEDVRVQRARLAATLGGEGALEALLARIGADGAEIDAIARRRAVVEAFLRANLEGTTQVTDAQVEEAFAEGEHPFAGMMLEQAREPLRAWLAMRALSADVARWVEVLRQRTPVSVLVALDPAHPTEGDDLDDDEPALERELDDTE